MGLSDLIFARQTFGEVSDSVVDSLFKQSPCLLSTLQENFQRMNT